MTSAAPGDNRLSAPVNSRLVKVKSWCVMGADGGEAGSERPCAVLILGSWPSIDTHQNTDAKQISISQCYSVPLDTTTQEHQCIFPVPPAETMETMAHRDGACLHWVLTGRGVEKGPIAPMSECSFRRLKCFNLIWEYSVFLFLVWGETSCSEFVITFCYLNVII